MGKRDRDVGGRRDDNDFIYLSRNVEQKRAQLRELFALTCLSLTIPTLEGFCFYFLFKSSVWFAEVIGSSQT